MYWTAQWRVLQVLCLTLIAFSFTSCRTYQKAIVTGKPVEIDNTYTNPGYAHGDIKNVLVLPLENPMYHPDVERYREDLMVAVLRNLGMFNYFSVQFDPNYGDLAGTFMDLDTYQVDRVKLGAVGKLYHADAVLKLAVTDYQVFPPMRMKIKVLMVDVNTGERIWAFDHVFDTDDVGVVNAMRTWWNTHRAGGDVNARFEVSQVRPSFFMNYVFHTLADSYGKSRVKNVASIEEQKKQEEKMERSIHRTQQNAYNHM